MVESVADTHDYNTENFKRLQLHSKVFGNEFSSIQSEQ